MADAKERDSGEDGETRTEDKGFWNSEGKEEEKGANDNETKGEKYHGAKAGGLLGLIQGIGEKIEDALSFGKPHADVVGFHLPSITTKQADVIIEVRITNPNPLPIPLLEIIYSIESEGRHLASGTIPDAGTIHAHGSETIKVPLTLIYKDIVDTFEDIHPGQVIGYLVKVQLVADVPVLGKLTLPLQKSGEIPIPEKPDVDVDKVVWDHLSLEQTGATMHINVKNTNNFEIGVKSLDYDLSLADVQIASADLRQSTTIGAKGSGLMQLPISFRPKDFGGALWDIIRGKGTGYSMSGNLEVDTPFGPMHLPYNNSSGVTQLKGKSEV